MEAPSEVTIYEPKSLEFQSGNRKRNHFLRVWSISPRGLSKFFMFHVADKIDLQLGVRDSEIL
jgi:hypothetical protein